LVPSGPSMLLTGSPTNWNSEKLMRPTTSITMHAWNRRWTMKASTVFR
jgi:hypothetical protein